MRVDDYDWKGLPPNLVEWLEDVTELINAGKISIRYYGTTTPSSVTAGQQGEMLLVKDGVTWKVYIYTDSTDTWQQI